MKRVRRVGPGPPSVIHDRSMVGQGPPYGIYADYQKITTRTKATSAMQVAKRIAMKFLPLAQSSQ